MSCAVTCCVARGRADHSARPVNKDHEFDLALKPSRPHRCHVTRRRWMMASAYPAVMTVVYTLEGAEITSLEEFWRLIGEAVNGPGGYFDNFRSGSVDAIRRTGHSFVLIWSR
jgi:hypothetical protein